MSNSDRYRILVILINKKNDPIDIPTVAIVEDIQILVDIWTRITHVPTT